jgi:hypothetical protein
MKSKTIFGASNLSRINVEPHPETQVACYPGAKLCHARGLIQKYNGSFKPEKIVINIGINEIPKDCDLLRKT